MRRKLLSISVIIFLFAIQTFAQENLLEKVELTFSLTGEPTPQDAGFDNPKSSWKTNYELYLIDFSELEKLGRCNKDEYGRHICPMMDNKKLDKQIRKKSLKVFKGSFTRKSLSSDANREVTVPINLPPEVIEIYNQATGIPEKNPTFILFVTEKVSVKNSAGAKLKKKYSINGLKPLKTADSNRTFEYWNVKNLSLNITIVKQVNGRLRFVGGLIH